MVAERVGATETLMEAFPVGDLFVEADLAADGEAREEAVALAVTEVVRVGREVEVGVAEALRKAVEDRDAPRDCVEFADLEGDPDKRGVAVPQGDTECDAEAEPPPFGDGDADSVAD